MILYIGNPEKGYWVEEVAKKHGMETDYVGAELHITDQVNDILAFPGCEYMVFELLQYEDNAEQIADYVRKISNANNAKVIVFAGADFLPESVAVQTLYKTGVRNFIFGYLLGDMKEQLEQCLNGFMEANIAELLEVREQAYPPEEAEATLSSDSGAVKKKKFIGLAGACHRMGTTTQALQLVKYIQLCGMSSCYIQMNDTGYVENLGEWFECERDEYLGCVKFGSVDMYYDQEHLPEILEMDYDYYVYDYGTYSDTSFNRTSFLEKDLQIFVVGSSPAELPYTRAIIKNVFYKNIEYIYTFTPENEKSDIMELMEEKREHTYFAAYAPDPFILSPNPAFDVLLGLRPEPQEKKKKGFFRRKG